MLIDLMIDASVVSVMFYLIPSATIVLSIIFYVLHKKLAKAGHPNRLKWLVEPLPIKPFIHFRKSHKSLEKTMQSSDGSKPSLKTRIKQALKQIVYRIIFVMIFATIAFTSEILAILFHESGHGFVVEAEGETWVSIHVGIFYGSCIFAFPYPPADWNAFYYKQLWISLGGFLVTDIMGVIFLLFLLIPQIRRSFYASLFCFAMCIVCITGGIEDWYGESWSMLYGMPPASSDTVGFMNYQAYLGLGITPQLVLDCMIVLMTAIQIIILIVGGRLWRNHYPKHRFSHVWFILMIESVWWYYFFSWV